MLDKQTAKLLKYIGKNNPTYQDIEKYLKGSNARDEINYANKLDSLLIDMAISVSITGTMHGSVGLDSKTDVNAPLSSGFSAEREVYALSPRGRAALEDYRKRNAERIWTRGIAIAALVISIVALLKQ